MDAGREMDALIAEKVFGMTPCADPLGRCEAAHATPCQCWTRPGEPYGGGLSLYSTDVASAWEVVEALARRGHYVTVMTSPQPNGEWRARVEDIDGIEPPALHVDAIGATAPEAICRVALLAVGGAA